MGTPVHLPDVRSRLRLKETSLQFQASKMITETFAHPQRSLFDTFIRQATDPEVASRFLLEEISSPSRPTLHEILADWVDLIGKVQPVRCDSVDFRLREILQQRDGNSSCIPPVLDLDRKRSDLVIVRILPLLNSNDNFELPAGTSRMCRMLVAYLGETKAQLVFSSETTSISKTMKDLSEQYMLLTPCLFEQFSNGRLALRPSVEASTETSAKYISSPQYFVPDAPVDDIRVVELQNRAKDIARLPSPQLLSVQERFAEALAWLEVSRYMKNHLTAPSEDSMDSMRKLPSTGSSWKNWMLQIGASFLHTMWLKVPSAFRSFTYARLALISVRYFGYTGSERTLRLPFNLYLRQNRPEWAPRHEAELHALNSVETYTQIPAPRGLDAVTSHDSAFLLMSGVPGRKVGQMIHTMTDNQIEGFVKDMERCLVELRCIPKHVGLEVQICNALGEGILDWRIGDSQREKLMFRNEKEFHECLIRDMAFDTKGQEKISKAYSIKHDIVFTHADLNMRNILVDEHGKLSGIVDWECAGWYPEYWEFTKMHFGARYTKRWIVDVVDRVFDKDYYDELNVEDMLASMKPPW